MWRSSCLSPYSCDSSEVPPLLSFHISFHSQILPIGLLFLSNVMIPLERAALPLRNHWGLPPGETQSRNYPSSSVAQIFGGEFPKAICALAYLSQVCLSFAQVPGGQGWQSSLTEGTR